MAPELDLEENSHETAGISVMDDTEQQLANMVAAEKNVG